MLSFSLLSLSLDLKTDFEGPLETFLGLLVFRGVSTGVDIGDEEVVAELEGDDLALGVVLEDCSLDDGVRVLVEVVEGLACDDPSDPRRHSLAGVTNVVLVREDLLCISFIVFVEPEFPVV